MLSVLGHRAGGARPRIGAGPPCSSTMQQQYTCSWARRAAAPQAKPSHACPCSQHGCVPPELRHLAGPRRPRRRLHKHAAALSQQQHARGVEAQPSNGHWEVGLCRGWQHASSGLCLRALVPHLRSCRQGPGSCTTIPAKASAPLPTWMGRRMPEFSPVQAVHAARLPAPRPYASRAPAPPSPCSPAQPQACPAPAPGAQPPGVVAATRERRRARL